MFTNCDAFRPTESRTLPIHDMSQVMMPFFCTTIPHYKNSSADIARHAEITHNSQIDLCQLVLFCCRRHSSSTFVCAPSEKLLKWIIYNYI